MTPPVGAAQRLSEAWATAADAADPLGSLRDRFRIPVNARGETVTYLAGHSLGAQPRSAVEAVQRELETWARDGVEGHFREGAAWVELDGSIREATARLVGARPTEVATMGSLTVNLHLLLASFFRPAGGRTAILIDAPTFPSDRYAIESQLRHHGLDPASDLVVVAPRAGEVTLRTEDLEAAIGETGDRLALSLLAGVNYATGQVLDIERLTAAAHAVGALAGWDLAHAAGNVPLSLHAHGVDFAAWCTYKYLNSGPGAPGQVFIHDRHGLDPNTPRLAGWWGNDPATRFEMSDRFRAAPGADGWRVSNPPVLGLAPVVASLRMFDEVGMPALRERSQRLTAYLDECITALAPGARIVTPAEPAARGSMLSVRLPDARRVLAALEAADVIGDFREPDIIRVAPVPMYDTFLDAWHCAQALAGATA